MKFKTRIGRNNLAVTVYFPEDCQNNCPFCTSKKEYSKCHMNKEKVKDALRLIVKNPNIKDVVITGGEPTSNPRLLAELVSIATYKNVYINTTLPSEHFFDCLEIFNRGDVKGVNISRHGTSFAEDSKAFRNIVEDWAFKGIEVPVKVNVVLTEKTTPNDMDKIIKRWENNKNVTVCFRRDFRKTTRETLHLLEGDELLDYLISKYEFMGHTFCDVCDTVSFAGNISFHRGLEKSSFKIGNTVVVNDIIIYPDGTIAYDWDKKPISEIDMFDAINNTSSNNGRKETSTRVKHCDDFHSCGTLSMGACGRLVECNDRYSCLPVSSCGVGGSCGS